jgi:predicted extracellular nuclease
LKYVFDFFITGDFQDGDLDEKRNLNGFFLQEEDSDADGNPDTSEGIFVYDPAFLVDVTLGDLVRCMFKPPFNPYSF